MGRTAVQSSVRERGVRGRGRAGDGWHLGRLFGSVLPLAHREVARWIQRAEAIPDPALRRQALDSLHFKRFHALGAAVYGALRRDPAPLVRFAVAYQIISDYLDNLADRDRQPPARREANLTCLHQAMVDGVSAEPPRGGYYRFHTASQDGGYLEELVTHCRAALAELDAWELSPRLVPLAARFARMQVLKHLETGRRGPALQAWAEAEGAPWPEVRWYEFAASAGSTLGIFALAAAAGAPPDHLDRLEAAYVPWLTAYHILLDYLIDLEEDRQGGDFNFVACYPSLDEAEARLRLLAQEAARQIDRLPEPAFHRLVLWGLAGLYLADAKAEGPHLQAHARRLLRHAGGAARFLAWLCRRANPFGQVAELQPPPVP
ncbi:MULTISPECIES: DUF2600 family protein [Limnochorda]|uniref:DUF2600 family protein n=1 Tax=Limnochorda TaxID=1676651 RepID=UPI0026EFD030|nr:DUF2600 family protein [Limnochorda pilosa]